MRRPGTRQCAFKSFLAETRSVATAGRAALPLQATGPGHHVELIHPAMWIGKRWGNWVSRPLVRRTACLLIRSTMRCSRRVWWPRSTWLAGVVPSAQAREATRVVIDADPDGWVVCRTTRPSARGLRTVLREPEGETPSGYSPNAHYADFWIMPTWWRLSLVGRVFGLVRSA